MKKRVYKIILIIAIIMSLTMSNFMFLGMSIISYASNEISSTTNHKNVEFSTYFKTNDGEKLSTLEESMSSDNMSLFMKIAVRREGYFNGKIQLSNSNFKFKEENKNEYVKSIKSNEITLNQIGSGQEIEIEIGIEVLKDQFYDLKLLNMESDISLEGTYMDSTEKAIDIQTSKSVNLRLVSEINSAKNELDVITNKLMSIDGEEKRVIQLALNIGLNENSFPIKNYKIEIDTPKIVDKENKDVFVKFNNMTYSNWSWDLSTEKITLNLTNGANSENKVVWNKEGFEKIVFTYIYDKDEVFENTVTAEATITLYDDKQIETKPSSVTISNQAEEKYGNLQIESIDNVNEIYKGNLLIGKDKEFETNTVIDFNYIKTLQKVELVEKESSYVLADGSEVDAKSLYTKTAISKSSLQRILGDDGTLVIKKTDGTVIFTINKEILDNANEDIEIEYPDGGISELKIEINNANKNGTLELKHLKVLKQVNEEKIKQAKLVRNFVTAKVEDESEIKVTSDLQLKDVVSEAKMEISKNSLSTVQENESIEIRAILQTNKENEALYKNPVIKIELPESVESLEIKDMNLIYGDDFKIKSKSVNGRSITIELEGEQTEYTEQPLEGPTLIINVDLKLNMLAKNETAEIKMTYTNAKTAYEGEAKTQIEIISPKDVITINNMTDYNVMTIGQEEKQSILLDKNSNKIQTNVDFGIINNYDSEISNIKVLGEFPVNDSTNNMDIVLKSLINFEQINQQVSVYYTDNENATNDLELPENRWSDSKYNTTNAKKFLIVISKLNVGEKILANYTMEIPEKLPYNKVAQLGYEVQFSKNSTENIQTLKATVLELTTGIGPNIETSVEAIVGGSQLKENETINAGEIVKYVVKLKNSGQEQAKNVELNINIPDEMVYVQKNVNNLYDMYEEKQDVKLLNEQKEKIGIDEEVTFEFELKAKEDIQQDTVAKLEITTKYNEKEEKNVITNTIEKSDLSAYIHYVGDEEVYEGSNLTYGIVIENLSEQKLENVEIELNDINGINVVRAELSKVTEDKESEEFEKEIELKNNKINIGDLEANQIKQITIELEVNEIEKAEQNIEIYSIIDVNNNQIKTNTVNLTGKKYDITVEMTSEKAGGYITPDDTIEYIISLKNNSDSEAIVQLLDAIPSELNVKDILINGKSVKGTNSYNSSDNMEDIDAEIDIDSDDIVYVDPNGEFDEPIENNSRDVTDVVQDNDLTHDNELTNDIKQQIVIGANQEVIVKIIVSIDGDKEDYDEEVKVSNKAQILSMTNKVVAETENVFYVIKNNNQTTNNEEQNSGTQNNVENNNTNNSDNSNDNQVQTTLKYIISGIAWLDKDNDEQLTKQDELLKDKEIKLLEIETGKIIKEVKTDENGEYIFSDLEKGEYMVICEYDTSKYVLVSYKKDGVQESKNSDVISKKLTLDNVEKVYASTDIIKIEDSSESYINIGFKEAKVFDLKLEKFVSKIIAVHDEIGTDTREYEEQTLAKIELDSKYVNNTTVIVEYKIKITNVGEVDAYVKKVADYMPSDLQFSSELNKDWYLSGKTLYNSSLANEKLMAGESKELTLTLTKVMTENNTGRFNNTAEIIEAYNELGLEDTNSTPGNRAEDENDMGSADIILGIKTGEAIFYTSIIFIILIIILAVIVLPRIKVNKKVRNAKLDKM